MNPPRAAVGRRFRPSQVIANVAIALVLLFAIGWGVLGESGVALARHGQSLAGMFPVGEMAEGWRGKFQPLAESQELVASTWQVLRYDDAVYVSYARGNDRVTVFCAYWKPGSMSYRSVAGHNPEVCWPGQGWNCTMKKMIAFEPKGSRWIFPLTRSQTYEMHGVAEHVLFWHMVGDKIYIAGPSSDVPGKTYLPDLFRMGIRQRGEQYFLRIASDEPFERLAQESLLADVLEKFARFGIMGTASTQQAPVR